MILITGAISIVGRELVPLLLARGQAMRARSSSPEKARVLFGSGIEVVLATRGSGASQRGMLPVEQITGRPPRSYAEWVDAHSVAFR